MLFLLLFFLKIVYYSSFHTSFTIIFSLVEMRRYLSFPILGESFYIASLNISNIKYSGKCVEKHSVSIHLKRHFRKRFKSVPCPQHHTFSSNSVVRNGIRFHKTLVFVQFILSFCSLSCCFSSTHFHRMSTWAYKTPEFHTTLF